MATASLYVYYNDDTFQEIAESLHQAITKLMVQPNSESGSAINFRQVKLIKGDELAPVCQSKSFSGEKDLFIMLGLNNETPYLPPRYVAYQFEQTGNQHSWFTETYLSKLRGAQEIWDYSIVNIQNLRKNYPNLPTIKYVPLGYSPCLHRITQRPSEEKRFDILFYGSACPRRNRMMNTLRHAGFGRIHYAEFSLWGEDRDRLIAESRIVLNLHYYPRPILETTRISYLVANSAFVISEPSLDPILDKEYANYVVFSDYDNLVQTCRHYLENPDQREKFARQAHLRFIQKDYSKSVPTELLFDSQNNTATAADHSVTTSASPSNHKTTNSATTTSSSGEQPKSESRERAGIIRPKFHQARVEEDGAILKLDNRFTPENCPRVSLITPTAGRTWALTSLAVRNFYRFNYPSEKLEWIILDSNPSEEVVALPPDNRIKYQVVDGSIPLWKKRNQCVEQATGEIIIHLDDDDFYFPSSIWAKVRALDTYGPEIQCVGTTELGIYHLLDNYSYLANTQYLSEASMAYTKDFWRAQQFSDQNLEMGEGYAFLKGRESQVVVIPYHFNLIALTHGQNYTGKLRTYRDDQQQNHDNFFNLWDRETQYFFLELKTKANKAQMAKQRIDRITHQSYGGMAIVV